MTNTTEPTKFLLTYLVNGLYIVALVDTSGNTTNYRSFIDARSATAYMAMMIESLEEKNGTD